jgi:hypothetical protein
LVCVKIKRQQEKGDIMRKIITTLLLATASIIIALPALAQTFTERLALEINSELREMCSGGMGDDGTPTKHATLRSRPRS